MENNVTTTTTTTTTTTNIIKSKNVITPDMMNDKSIAEVKTFMKTTFSEEGMIDYLHYCLLNYC